MCLFWRKHRHKWSKWEPVEREESNSSMLGVYKSTRTINQRQCAACGFIQERKADG